MSTWKEGMNFSKGLTFATKVKVKHALTIYALKENKHFVISRSTKVKLCAKCVDESRKWYVVAFIKPKLHELWMVTIYVGPQTCIPIGLRNDDRMMDFNFITSDILKKLDEDHTTPIKHLRSMMESKYDGHKPSYFKVWDAKQKVIRKIFGNWEESYQRLQKLLLAYVDQDPDTRVKSRLVKSRIRNEMDGVKNKDREPGKRREDADLIKNQPKQTCGLFHASGHNRRKCLEPRGAFISDHVPN
ncbi:hypothetical protein SO802_021304 [Lithocarpus litseifolius]|uniref:Uncharacterized protein n=1 Tax=Lithocarpus litseifolius TaxID=425828 RepID=A0AAW2CGM3_9ROSI